MSETEPKYYTKSEANHMLEEVEREIKCCAVFWKRELFSKYEQMQQEIDDLKIENENLKERIDALKG